MSAASSRWRIDRLYRFWGHLTDALRTGELQNETKSGGVPLFEALYADPVQLKGFLAAMTGISHGANLAIAEKVSWGDYTTFADIGTAQGDLAVQIALAHPHLSGVGFDLPQVGPVFEDYVSRNGLESRLRFLSGDFFKDALPQADVITMGHILHDWSLDEKRMLIGKAYDALPAGGALVVYDAIIDDDRSQNAFGLLMSLNMLIETEAGFDYTAADCAGWMTEAGFASTQAVAPRRAGLDGGRDQVAVEKSRRPRLRILAASTDRRRRGRIRSASRTGRRSTA